MAQVSGSTTLASLFPSRWLRAEQLIEDRRPEVTLTVAGVSIEEVHPQAGTTESKPALRFTETDKLYLLNKTDSQTLQSAGFRTVADLAGARVTIGVASFRGRSVLRIRSASRPAAPVVRRADQVAPDLAHLMAHLPEAPVATPVVEPDVAPAGEVTAWPPSEAWVKRNAKGGVDWATSFWQLAALRQVNANDARALIAAAGGDIEAATQDLYQYPEVR